MNFTQEQLDTIQLPIRGKRIKLEVLNTDFQTLATLEGNTTGGSLQKDATNFVRRSGSIQMCVPNIASAETFLDYIEGVTISVNGKIWLDKYIKIWVGIENYVQPYGKAPKTVWYNFGICLIDQPVRTFGSDGYTMSFNVIDLSAKMNGDRSGQLAVTTTLFPRVQGYDSEGKPIYTVTEDALASCIGELTEFKRYTIYPVPQKWKYLPYDIKMEVGSTVYSALEQFLNILSGWQMYFDNDGVFVVEPIPSGANDIVYPLNLQLNTQDVNSVDFNNVRNQVIVYGRSHNIDFYSESVALNQNLRNLIIDFDELDLQKINVGATIFGFKQQVPVSVFAAPLTLTINYNISGVSTNLVTDAPIYWYGDEEHDKSITLLPTLIYTFRIKSATTYKYNDLVLVDFTKPVEFELLGRQQAQACVVNGNRESPYYINKHQRPIGYYGECFAILGGSSTPNYQIRLTENVTFDLSSFRRGEIISFYIPTNTGQTAEATIFGKNELASGGLLLSLYGLPEEGIGGDYTIWDFKLSIANNQLVLSLVGRNKFSNTLVESGGVYDNIYADSLARERAEYDLFLHTNMQNTVTLSCVPDYSIDVNYRIKYNQSSALPPDAVVDETFEDKYFITKQVSYPLGMDGSTQTINAIEIYDDYNYVGYAYDLPTTS